MKKLLAFGAVALAAIVGLASCGGGGNTLVNPGGGGGTAEVASITVLAASPQLPSDQTGVSTVQITAQVKDAANAVIEDATVSFGATSGSLAVTQPVSDGAGLAIAQLSNGTNPANRSITVTATSGGVSGSVVVSVTGSTVTVAGPAALASGQSGNYTATVKDSKGLGVQGVNVTVTSANGNPVAASTLTTDVTGNIAFSVTANNPGNDTITVSALGLTTTAIVNVSGDVFVFTAPAPATDINLGAVQNVTARWTKNGAPPAGPNNRIRFSTTRGTLSNVNPIAVNGSGDASVTIQAPSAGPAVITATNDDGATTTLNVEFVATTPNTIELQASPLTVATGGPSELVAIVRDAANNLVKNQTVQFVIVTDITGGALSVGSATTDSQGRARSVYTGGSVQSAANGVVIRAVVQGTAIEDTVNLTVARQELFITLGTGNTLFEIGTATYAKEWVILVTDVEGNAVSNKVVQAAIRSRRYFKGQLAFDPVPSAWRYAAGSPERCDDEDTNKNGIFDAADVDGNNNGILEAGNIALVAAVPESAPLNNPCATAGAQGVAANVTTNAQGRARVCVFYPQNYAQWLEAAITAKASVSGTEFSRSTVFVLDVLADDVNDEDETPPNIDSPFGVDLDCAVPPPAP